jgi:hypothetical protein
MITDQEALDAIDPALPEEERVELAARVKASSAALDAYYDSRPQMEQLLAEVSGAKYAPAFPVGKAPAAAGAGETAGALAAADAAVADAEVVETAEEKELKELEARVAALQASKKE